MTDALLAADTQARAVALTALDRTLLVEAGAGSGKTSVLAGRVASLLAAGTPPAAIAAITFTELAAGELRERVCAFVAELADGTVRPDLHAAFPHGVGAEQQQRLAAAREALDELLCTTIHGFCQRLLRPYPVEAGMDPGATVMDEGAAQALFDETLQAWLRERLGGVRQPDDLLVALYLARPNQTRELLGEIARHLQKHRDSDVPDMARLDDVLADLRIAVQRFRDFLHTSPCEQAETADIVAGLEEVLRTAPGAGHEAEQLPHLLGLPVPAACATSDGGFRSYRHKGKWQAALKAAGSKLRADRLNDAATSCYAACKAAHEAVGAYAAGRVLRILADELRVVLRRFAIAKRDTALVDFDDLLVEARDLLARNPAVRDALHARFAAILVDEFQDTDRLQCEILWRLCAQAPDPAQDWTEWTLRPGALFLVGDPKQAIYRFRGADVASYVAGRTRLAATDAAAQVVIAQNFRSLGGILDWVNARFAPVLSAPLQPGFQTLFTMTKAPAGHVAVASLPVDTDGCHSAGLRDAEAEAVAAFCARIIGALPVRGRDGARACRPDDIALLAPSGTDLWRYERALEQAGIAVSTQAGKGFYRRQEVQDLIALTRVLADSNDTLALGALLRGPLVGLTEEELLDATGALPETNGAPGRLRLWTALTDVAHRLLRETLEILQALARQANATTPFVLLSQAVEELQLRPLLRQRQDRTAERALANLDQYLEAARPYDVRGLGAFASAMRAQWADGQRAMEGRPDTEQQAVSLVTIHSSKGLEWPVVIPVNLGGRVKTGTRPGLDAQGRLHLPVFGTHGPGGGAVVDAEAAEEERQRHRLWYVAATRARDLLLLPGFSGGAPKGSFMEKVGLQMDGLETFDADALAAAALHRGDDPPNPQDRAVFLAEADLIAARSHTIRRVTPHLAELGDGAAATVVAVPAADAYPAPAIPTRGSRARGLLLHKLLEEVLTGELEADVGILLGRASELAGQLNTTAVQNLDAAEMAATVLRGLSIECVGLLRPTLIPELTILAARDGPGRESVTSGIADAVAVNGEGIAAIIDWKSDVLPQPATIAAYKAQLSTYMVATEAAEGLLVLATDGCTICMRDVKDCA